MYQDMQGHSQKARVLVAAEQFLTMLSHAEARGNLFAFPS